MNMNENLKRLHQKYYWNIASQFHKEFHKVKQQQQKTFKVGLDESCF